VTALVERAKGPGPLTLDLSDNPLGDAGVRTLVSSPWLSRVRVLVLDHVGVEGADVSQQTTDALAASPYLANLEELSLNRGRGAYAAIDVGSIAGSPYLQKLRILRAWNCFLSERDLRRLVCLPHLETLVMGDSGLSAQRFRELREEFKGRLRIV
jgi:hypothetical protein